MLTLFFPQIFNFVLVILIKLFACVWWKDYGIQTLFLFLNKYMISKGKKDSNHELSGNTNREHLWKQTQNRLYFDTRRMLMVTPESQHSRHIFFSFPANYSFIHHLVK